MRVFIGSLLVFALGMEIVCAQTIFAETPALPRELRIVSRNSLVFVDSVREGEAREGESREWAPYRVVDETRPVIFKVEGPGRLVLKLRTLLDATNREGVAAVLRDGTIVLTARIPAVRDPEVKVVEGGKRTTKARTFLVVLDEGEHTVAIRYSEGPAVLVYANFIEGETRAIAAGEGEELPIVDPRAAAKDQIAVQRVGKVAVEGEVVEELATEPSPLATEPSPLAQKEAWEKERETAPVDVAAPSGPELEEAQPFQQPAATSDPARRSSAGTPSLRPAQVAEPRPARAWTQPAPYLSIEVRGGLAMSRLGLDVAPVIGADVRVPIPKLDARRFSFGVSIDASYARGQAAVIAGETRTAIDVAKLSRASVDATLDVRAVIIRIADVLDPYVAVGGGVSAGTLSAEFLAETKRETTVVPIGVLRIGAAFGDIGNRPFIEISGTVAEDDATIKVGAGFRFEILGEAPTD